MSKDRENKIFVGKLSRRVRESDLEHEFSKFGRIRDLDFRDTFAFIEFSHTKAAEEAVDEMHDRTFKNSRIVVEFKSYLILSFLFIIKNHLFFYSRTKQFFKR